MKVTDATLMVNVENKIEVGPLKLNVIHQVCLYKGKNNKVEFDIDFIDQGNITYMGVPIDNGYESWKKFTNFHKEMGIDFNKLIDEEAAKLVNDITARELLGDIKYKKVHEVICSKEGC